MIGFVGSRFNLLAAARRATTLGLYEQCYAREMLALRFRASRLILRDHRNLDAPADDNLVANY